MFAYFCGGKYGQDGGFQAPKVPPLNPDLQKRYITHPRIEFLPYTYNSHKKPSKV